METLRQTVDRVRTFRAAILERYRGTPLFACTLADVKRVVIINSSSRSGSSLLYTLLRRLPQVYSLTGEAAPFYKLNTDPDGFDLFASDKIPDPLLDRVIDRDGLARDFFSDLYCVEDEIRTAEIDRDRYADRLLLRFALQWTEVPFDAEVLRRCIDGALDAHGARHPLFDTEEFYLDLLERVVAAYPAVNPFYYDLGTDRVALRFPFTEIPVGPPNALCTMEEPPFILQPPHRTATPADLSDRILLLKSTVDCYRMNLIERLFPEAEIRVIHLVRNPAATANGIYDGWLHRGFFSHNLQPYLAGGDGPDRLSIKGYSDRFPFGGSWWNFDLPEGWQEYADRDLVEVCGFQWRSANREILTYLERSGRPVCRVPFEEIIRSIGARRDAFGRLLEFMGISGGEAARLDLSDLPVVQSTLPPQLYRWKKREEIITRLLDDPQLREMCGELGYDPARMEEWL